MEYKDGTMTLTPMELLHEFADGSGEFILYRKLWNHMKEKRVSCIKIDARQVNVDSALYDLTRRHAGEIAIRGANPVEVLEL